MFYLKIYDLYMNDLFEISGIEQVSKQESARKWISAYLEDVLLHMDDRSGTLHENTFYLNSSDSLETLLTLNLQGKKVLTVSGSGEFAHAFISAGAQEVCSFDISPAACFYTELRHAALCELEMSDYLTLFGSWAIPTEEIDDLEEIETPLLDINIYEKIESSLSEEAKAYFRALFQEPMLFYSRFGRGNNFARSRWNPKTKYNRLVGDIIKDEDEYNRLREKAKRVVFKGLIQNAFHMEEFIASEKPDVIYISNIGYEPDVMMLLAKKYLDLGVAGVICTTSSNDSKFNDTSGEYDYDFSNFYYLGRKLGVGDVFEYKLYDKMRRLSEIVTVEVLGTDKSADYGLTLKVGV